MNEPISYPCVSFADIARLPEDAFKRFMLEFENIIAVTRPIVLDNDRLIADKRVEGTPDEVTYAGTSWTDDGIHSTRWTGTIQHADGTKTVETELHHFHRPMPKSGED